VAGRYPFQPSHFIATALAITRVSVIAPPHRRYHPSA